MMRQRILDLWRRLERRSYRAWHDVGNPSWAASRKVAHANWVRIERVRLAFNARRPHEYI